MTARIEDSQLAQRVMSVCFTHSDIKAPEITFGSIKASHVAPGSKFVWPAVDYSQGLWEVKVPDVFLDNRALSLCPREGGVAALLWTPAPPRLLGFPRVITRSDRRWSRSHALEDDCNRDGYPTLGFQLNDMILHLGPRDYVEPDCQLSFMTLDIPPPKGPVVLLGVSFHVKYYTINMQLGFALAHHLDGEASLIAYAALRSNSSSLLRRSSK